MRTTPQQMPEAPAPTRFLSSTTTSEPERPWPSSSSARWYAVERPWMPAPMTTYVADSGRLVTGYCLLGNGISKWTVEP